MIPHHEGAVNMAKAALKLGGGGAGFAALAPMLRNVVVTQNQQVLEMQAWRTQHGAGGGSGAAAAPGAVAPAGAP
jgi:uncharacterized protein (DUF305 family)